MDLTCSLQESVAGEWNGDVDLGNGKLQLYSDPSTPRDWKKFQNCKSLYLLLVSKNWLRILNRTSIIYTNVS